MRSRSLYTSAGVHVAVLLISIISWPFLKHDFVVPPPISVEFATVAKETMTNKVAPPAPKEEKKDEKKAPPPAPKNDAKQAVAPKPPAPQKTEDKKEEPKKEDTVPDKKVPPKKEPPKKEPPKKEEPKKDFSSVLKNLADVKEKPPAPPVDDPDAKPDKDATAEEGQKAPIGEKMTMSEEDALRHQLEKCWNVPFGAKDADKLSVDIFMTINPDRTLKDAKIVDTSRYDSDSFFRAAADSALRAVRNPLCSPFQLPPDKYDTWKNTTVTFDPSDMF